MENQILQILVICNHAEILQTILRLLKNNTDWQAQGVLPEEAALKLIRDQPLDVILLGAGITPEDEHQFRSLAAAHQPKAVIIQHYGGGSGLLYAEIYEALRSASAPS